MNPSPRAGSAVFDFSLMPALALPTVTGAAAFLDPSGASSESRLTTFGARRVEQLLTISPRVSAQVVSLFSISAQPRSAAAVAAQLPRLGKHSVVDVMNEHPVFDTKISLDAQPKKLEDKAFPLCPKLAQTQALSTLPLAVLSIICSYLPSRDASRDSLLKLTTYLCSSPSLLHVRAVLNAAGYDTSAMPNVALARQMLAFDERYLKIIPLDERSFEMCQKAVLAGCSLAYVPSQFLTHSDLCLAAIKHNSDEWCLTPQVVIKNASFGLAAAKANGLVLRQIVASYFPSLDLCLAAVAQNNLAIDFVPPIYLERHEGLLKIAAQQYHIHVGDSALSSKLDSSQNKSAVISIEQRALILTSQADIFSLLDVATDSWPMNARPL
jgi:hypothetical protein